MADSKLVKFLLDHNKKMSDEFSSPDVALWRDKYRCEHPTEIAAFKCMDGRLNLSLLTHTPTGIIQPFRNVGGKFDLGWPYLGELVGGWVNYSISKGRDCMIFLTYHWSDGDPHRGCKGFNYDKNEACKCTSDLKKQVERIFGKNHSVVYPILLGVETDTDALYVHGENGTVLNLNKNRKITEEELEIKLHIMFPDMKKRMVKDLMPLLLGNLKHIEEIEIENRPIEEAQHQEQIVAVGRGFDWLHLPNKALIIGPFSYDLADPVSTAAKILWSNIEEKRIPKSEGVVLLASAVFREEAGPERTRAIEKAQSLARFSEKVILDTVPELKGLLSVLPGIVNLNTRKFTRINY